MRAMKMKKCTLLLLFIFCSEIKLCSHLYYVTLDDTARSYIKKHISWFFREKLAFRLLKHWCKCWPETSLIHSDIAYSSVTFLIRVIFYCFITNHSKHSFSYFLHKQYQSNTYFTVNLTTKSTTKISMPSSAF